MGVQGRSGAEPEVTGGGDADPAANAGRDEQGAGRAFSVPRGPAAESFEEPDPSIRTRPPVLLLLAHTIRENLQLLVGRPNSTYCFRLHNDRVYYVSEKIFKLVANISGDRLLSLGTCFGKFTKTHKFRLHIIALDYLAPYAEYQV